MRIDLGIEIVVVVAQPFQRFEIFVMVDRSQHPAELAEFFPIVVVGKSALLRQSREDVALADRDELVVGAVARGWCATSVMAARTSCERRR